MEINNSAVRWAAGADGKTGVYHGQDANHQRAQDYKQEIKQLKDAVKSDPDMSSNEKKAALKQLNYMEENAHLALDFTTMGTAYNVHHKDKYDNNAKVIDEVMGRIEYAMKEFNKMAPHIGGTQVPPPERHVMMEANVMYDGVYAGPTDQSSSANK